MCCCWSSRTAISPAPWYGNFYAAFADLYWRAMTRSGDATLAAIAAKSEKEMAYHLRHSSEWMVRLGDGTAESHARAQAAIDELWAFTARC